MTKLDGSECASIAAVAERLADAAGAAILPFFRSRGLSADNKAEAGRFDPVTAADRASERAMLDILARERPDDAIHGEEFGKRTGTTGLTWILDPIDGTRGFLSGTPTWGVLVAVRDDTGPVFGIVDQPFTGERFVGGFGQARLTRGAESWTLRTRATERLGDAILFSTFPEVGTEAEGRAFRAVSSRCRLTRYGMDCYAYALLALGQIDLVIEAGLEAYDVAAPIAVIEAAGGLVTDWTGGPAHDGGRVLAAANPALHAEALALLSRETGG